MKKTTLLNIALSHTIASLGHGDRLVLGDAGLPIHDPAQRIDLAVAPGVPSIEQVLHATLSEMQVERVLLAQETQEHAPALVRLIQELLPGVPLEWVTHEELKLQSRQARAVVRTGEFTPYANVILVAGVVF
jgi:D-ribose pyranase